MWRITYLFTILICSQVLYSLDYNREVFLISASKYVGIIENKGNNNRGDTIDKMNRYAGISLGSAYCCAFVSYQMHLINANFKKSGSCYNFSVNNNLKQWNSKLNNDALVEGSLIVWQRANRTGHIAIVEKKSYKKHIVMTIEANTSADNSSPDGRNNKGKQGVFRKIRDLTQPLMTGCELKFYKE